MFCVAQFGRALGSGPRGRTFKSCHSDQKKKGMLCIPFSFGRIISYDVRPLQERTKFGINGRSETAQSREYWKQGCALRPRRPCDGGGQRASIL